jgi:pyroglutamyl-peptidase
MKPEPAPLLVGAFEPFNGRSRNRAWEAAHLLDGAEVAGRPVEVHRLPTAFSPLEAAVHQLITRHPAALLLVGEAGPARRLMVERLAINVAHAAVRDNLGHRPVDDVLVPGGDVARLVAFDPRILCNAALTVGVACEVSSHAGTFCCNAAFYHALGAAAEHPERPLVAFVHVPARWPWARDRRTARGLLAIGEALLRQAAGRARDAK